MRDSTVVAAAERIPKPSKEYPGGYKNQIEAALIDAVFSIQSKYGSETTGVRAVVRRYRDAVGDPELDQLDRLASMDPDKLTRVLQNAQTVSGRPQAEAVQEAARTSSRPACIAQPTSTPPVTALHTHVCTGWAR